MSPLSILKMATGTWHTLSNGGGIHKIPPFFMPFRLTHFQLFHHSHLTLQHFFLFCLHTRFPKTPNQVQILLKTGISMQENRIHIPKQRENKGKVTCWKAGRNPLETRFRPNASTLATGRKQTDG